MRNDIATDFVVIGSGAAGSVLAYNLAAHGERVVLLERGKRVRPEEMSHDELAMISLLYKDGGSQMNTSADMFLLQGNVVGGSTVLTNGVCFRAPEEVLRGWDNMGFALDRAALNRSYERVEGVLNVAPHDESVFNAAAGLLARGMRELGIKPGRFNKNFLGCIGCGYCNMGCRFGRKLDAAQTWVPMAESHDCELISECEVMRLEHANGSVSAALCRDHSDGSEFRVHARRFVLSGGAINSPELLLKSRIARGTAGYRTSFNCGAIMFAEYAEDLAAFDGDQMCVYHMAAGYAIEQVHNPPLTFALTLPGWYERHHRDLASYRRLTSAGVLCPTQPAGRVFLGIGRRLARRWFDHAEIEFRLPEHDLATLREGYKQLARIYLASGAVRVIPPTSEYTEIRRPQDVDVLDRVMRSQRDIVGFGSSHPQGGCVGGGEPRRDTVTPEFAVRNFDNLFICDASVFPGSIKVNPMLTIMAMADYATRHIGGFVPSGEIREGPAYEHRQRREIVEARV